MPTRKYGGGRGRPVTGLMPITYPLGGCQIRAPFGMLVLEANMGTWNELSSELSQAVQSVGNSIVTVEPGNGRTFSGIILDEKTILTTARGIRDHENIRVWTSPDNPGMAALKGSDPGTDIAILDV